MSNRASQIDDVAGGSTVGSVANVLKFLLVVRLRKGVLVCTILLSLLLGGLHYATATRLYESAAELLVVRDSANVMEGNTDNQRVVQDFMPTYERILVSDEVLNRAIKSLPPEHRIDLKGVPVEERALAIKNRTSVSSARRTNVININYRSKNPQTAAVVIESILSAYIGYMHETHKGNARELLDVLTGEKDVVERNLVFKENELMRLRSAARNLVDTDDKSENVVIDRAMQLGRAWTDAQQKSIQAQASYAAIVRAVERGEDIQQFLIEENEHVGGALMMEQLGLGSQEDYMFARLQLQLVEDKAEWQRKQENYGQNHPQVKELANRIALNEQWLSDRRRQTSAYFKNVTQSELAPRLIQMAGQKLRHAREQEQALANQFHQAEFEALGLNEQMARIEQVGHELNRLMSNYDTLLEKIKNIDLNQSTGLRTSILKQPEVFRTPVSPRLTMTIFLCLMGGCSSGLVIIYVLDTLDDRFRSPDDLRLQLGVPVLAMVRDMEPTGGTGWDSVHTYFKPNGVESEAFRTLRTSLSFSGEETQRIVVSSTEPSDGKTTVLSNLAVAYAQAGKRTLLIDADMRRPGLSTMLGLRGHHGLSDVLRETRPVSECAVELLVHGDVQGLNVLPAGPRPVNPAELLASDRFSDLLAWAETAYDQILVDAPPALAVSDPTIIGRLVEGVLLVVRPDKNRRKMVIRAVETFLSVNVPLFGVVVNHLTPESGGDYYGYGYGYGYGNEYGHDDEAHPDDRGSTHHAFDATTDDSHRDGDDSNINFYRAA